MPFQVKWPLGEKCKEGTIWADVVLRSLDGRTLSPRKLMVRASLGVMGEALEPQQAMVYTPDELPKEICLLRQSYPVQLLCEAGEKLFSLEDTLPIPGNMPEKLLCSRLKPIVTEQAVTGGHLVLRGQVQVCYVAMDPEGKLCSGGLEMPFAQFAELDQEHDKEAIAMVLPLLSDGECHLSQDGLSIKCGVIVQYGVYDRRLLEIAEDAYSPGKVVTPTMETVDLPVLLDHMNHSIEVEEEMPLQTSQVVDITFLPDHPVQYRQDAHLVVEIPGMFQTLYYDQDQQLQCASKSWSGRWELPAGDNCGFRLCLAAAKEAAAVAIGDRVHMSTACDLHVQTCAQQGLPMVTGLEIGAEKQLNPDRPSVIIRKTGGSSLWDLAKQYGSTVEAIEQVNQLSGQPTEEQMLLIPVL